MEALGVVANVIAVVDLGVKVASLCGEYINNVKDARADIFRLQQEVDGLGKIAKHVRELIQSPRGASLKASQDLADSLQASFSRLATLERTLEPHSSRKVMSRFGLRALKWPFHSNETLAMIQEIRRYTNMISLAIQVDQTTVLLEVDQKAGEIDKKLFSVEQQMALKNLPMAPGASFDSHAEEHNPVCLENTRVELLQDVQDWIYDPNAAPIFWLNGMAGTGKSTICRTVARLSADLGDLGGSFFFKRGENDRGNMSRFYTTIAAQLVRSRPHLAHHVKNAIDNDANICEKTATEQFTKLILQPLTHDQHTSQREILLIVVDALDECDGDDDIRQLINLFKDFNTIHHLHLRAFMTSRPELPVRLGFRAIQGNYRDLILHEISEPIINHDLSIFFKHQLARIKHEYDISVTYDRQLPSDWPGHEDTQTLVQMAIPLFIFAATVCRFLADRRCGNPEQQLRKVLAYKTKSQESKMEATYLPTLNQQLTGLSVREQHEVIKEFRYIVGTIVVLLSPLSTSALARFLDLSRDDLHGRLDMLHSVLSIPNSANGPVKLLHLSFRDFLLDPEKRDSNPFWVDEKHAHDGIATACLNVMNARLREDICDMVQPGISRSAITSEQIQSRILPEVQYASRYWAQNVHQAERQLNDDGEVFEFLNRHFLHWLETLCLIGRASDSLASIKLLQQSLEATNSQRLEAFLDHAHRFIQQNLRAIDTSPLQLYSSLLVLSPSTSIIRTTFWDKVPQWISLPPNPGSRWDECRQVLEGHTHGALSVAFSADSSHVASTSYDQTLRVWRADTGECIRVIEFSGVRFGHTSLTLSADSSLVALICEGHHQNHRLQIWKTNSGEFVAGCEAVAFAFSEDSTLLAVVSYAQLSIIQLDGFKLIHRIEFPVSDHISIKFSRNLDVFAVLERAGRYRVFRVDTGECVQEDRTYDIPEIWVGCALEMSDDYSLITAILDEDLWIWPVGPGNKVVRIEGKELGFTGVSFSPDQTIVGSTSRDGAIRLWKVETGECIQVFKGHTGYTTSMSFSANGQLVASTSRDKTIRLWTVDDPDAILEAKSHVQVAAVVEVSSDGSLIVSGSSDGSLKLWRADTGECFKHFRTDIEKGRIWLFCLDAGLVATIEPTEFRLWQLETGECIHQWSLDEFASAPQPTFSPNGAYIALSTRTLHSESPNLQLAIWQVDTRRYRHFLQSPSDDTAWSSDQGQIFFSPDSMLVGYTMTRWHHSIVLIWRVDTGQCISRIDYPMEANHTAISPDSQLLALSFHYFNPCVFRISDGEIIWNCEGAGSVRSYPLLFSPDSNLLAQSSYTGKVRLWDVASGNCAQNIRLDFQPHKINFSSDMKCLLTNFGAVAISPAQQGEFGTKGDMALGHHPRSGYGISGDGSWLMWNDIKFFWFPARFRPVESKVVGSTIAIVCEGGRLLILRFNVEQLLTQLNNDGTSSLSLLGL